ncbi:hypothetical protein L3Y34_019309 [Caenorhabditis briggsae]|uniref:Uncharacterized protein n=1 Tax=Caenorhabditis briggsae TaxID=6238 RepID=A0AAE9DMY9_CAEBR|nr:hypothetical protein L3Y34_019309 [Caenorhabditis briggsae]
MREGVGPCGHSNRSDTLSQTPGSGWKEEDPEDGLRTDLEVARLENKRLKGIIVQQLFRINHLEELLDQARELHREAEKSAREILEEEIKDDRVNFGKAKEKWFVNNGMKDEKINELESSVKALAEEKDVHVGRIAT